MVCDGRPPFAGGGGNGPLIDETSSAVAVWFASLCSVLGVLGNTVTIGALFGHPGLRRHPTTPFLLSLAFSDLVYSGFNLPLLAARFHYREWVMGYSTCVLFPFFLYSNIAISTFSMALIAVNRFVGIYYNHTAARVFTRKKVWMMVFAAWTLAFAFLSLPLAEVWGQMGYVESTFSCTILPKDNKTPMTFLIVVGAVLPFIIMVVCYGLIYWKVRQTGKEVDAASALGDDADVTLTSERSMVRARRQREQQLTRTLVLICASYMVCFLPSALIGIFDPMPPCYKNPQLHVATYIVFWCSAFTNPLIYTLTNANYRQAHFAVLGWVFACRKPQWTLSTISGQMPVEGRSRSSKFFKSTSSARTTSSSRSRRFWSPSLSSVRSARAAKVQRHPDASDSSDCEAAGGRPKESSVQMQLTTEL